MKLYIETSVPNMLTHNDAPDKMRITALFMQWIALSSHELFISPVLLKEIARTPGPRRALLEKTVRELGATMVAVSAEAEELARHYASAQIVPARYQDDALHVAVAVCHRTDMIVSWNMKHLANPNKVALINVVNRQNGWPLIRIHTPQEVMGL